MKVEPGGGYHLSNIFQTIKQYFFEILKSDFWKNIIIYTGIFLILAIIILRIFNLYDKALIWREDGVLQHIINLQYFRSLIVNFLRTGNISFFTWNIGMGIDMFSNMAYYILGDIFSYFAIFFPSKSLENVYSGLVLIRMYFIGISFLCYCKYKKMNSLSSIIGALMYAFCFYSLYAAPRHPYFMNALIILPLALIGIEKIIIEDRHLFYTIIIALNFISSFYFGYMIALVIAIYGTFLAIFTYKKEGYKKIIKVLGKTLLYSVIGIMISGIILLPAGIGFISSERTSSNIIYPYTINYYRNYLLSLLSNKNIGYWLCLGTQSIVFLTIPSFIRKRKENYPLFLTFILLIIPTLISQIGSIFSGFNFPNIRYTFCLSFIFAYITTIFLNNKIDKKDIIGAAIFILIFLGINVLCDINITLNEQFQLFILGVLVFLLIKQKHIEDKFPKVPIFKIVFLLIFVVGISWSINDVYQEKNYTSEFITKGELQSIYNTSYYSINDFSQALKFINKKDKDNYRILKHPFKYPNGALAKNYNSLGYYYSISPSLASALNKDLENSDYYINHNIREFNYRTKITTLLGTKYYIAGNDNNSIPYGYSLINKYKGTSKIYQNKYALPFAVLYDNYISEDDYNKLSPLEKENALLKSVVLPSKNSKISYKEGQNFNNNIKEVNYKLEDSKHIFTENNKIEVKSNQNNSFQLKIGEVINSEIYIAFKNIEFKSFTKQEKIDKEITETTTKKQIKDIKKKYKWYRPSNDYRLTVYFANTSRFKAINDYYNSPYYMETKDIVLNLGYYDKASGTITISLSNLGNYNYDSIKVYAVSMDDYENDINNLRKSNFKLQDYGNGYLNGTVDCEENGVLQFSTLYTKGWKVYVDDKEVKNFKANKYFLGINITKGKHTISLKYHNPYLTSGAIMSIIGIISLVILTKRNKKNSSLYTQKIIISRGNR